MPGLTLTCLSPQARELVLSEMGHIKGEKAKAAFAQMVKEIPQCPIGQSVGIATGHWTSRNVRGTDRKPRTGWRR